jgi:erythromycin esterase-like protein
MDTITASGKRLSLTAHADAVMLDPTGRGSVEYAKARVAIKKDFQENFKMNQPLAKRLRKQTRHIVVDHLKGKVSLKKSEDKKEKDYYIVTFPDGSVARL